jgi:hypothetical protein
MDEKLNDDLSHQNTTNVIAKQDFYWYDLLVKLGFEVNTLWYSKPFVKLCKGKLKPAIYRRLKKHAHNRRYFLGIEHEPYEHRRLSRKSKGDTDSESYFDDGDTDWKREMAQGS